MQLTALFSSGVTFILPLLTPAQRADALAPQTRICLCGTMHNNPMHSGDALARAVSKRRRARTRKMRQNH
jgi:hypothetical protein